MVHYRSPLKIKKENISNRIVVAPMASQTADENGFVTLKTIKHYERLASSQAGIVIVEYSYIDKSGKSEINQLAADDLDKVEGLSRISKVIAENGCIPILQIVHGGSKTTRELIGEELIAPSAIPVPVKDRVMEVPLEADINKINFLKQVYLRAMRIALMSGFKGVEIHSAHGYGFNQWLSPLTNKRDDCYGGSLKNRLRLLTEIINLAKQNYPSLILSVRLPGEDFIPGGLTLIDTIEISKILESIGVDLLNISSGIGGWRRPRNRKGEGYLVDDAAKIQSEVKIPVLGVGGIKTSDYINAQLIKGRFSLAVIGRAMLKNPRFLNL